VDTQKVIGPNRWFFKENFYILDQNRKQHMTQEEKNILVWGMHGVGKSSMIDALPHELAKLSKDDGFTFKLTLEQNDNESLELKEFRVKPSFEKIEPTKSHETSKYNLSISLSNDPGKILKKYKLVFVDDRGDAMKDALDNNKDLSSTNNLIRNYLNVSSGVIALFEYGSPLELPHENRKQSGFYTQADLLISLIDILAERKERKDGVFLALCINKIDKTRLRWKDPMVAFEMFFDYKWSDILSIMNFAKTKNVQIDFFVTSMVGYCRNSQGMTVPNYSGKDISDKKIMRPWNSTAPLFWMLGNIEYNIPFPWFPLVTKKVTLELPKSFF
jgi:GTPase SAR1 family protein